MLQDFLKWANEIVSSPPVGVTDTVVTLGEESDNQSARLDIDTSIAMGRVTCWESGNFDAEILDFESEQRLFFLDGMLRSDISIHQQLSSFLGALEGQMRS